MLSHSDTCYELRDAVIKFPRDSLSLRYSIHTRVKTKNYCIHVQRRQKQIIWSSVVDCPVNKWLQL